jgi:hypothetical protein
VTSLHPTLLGAAGGRQPDDHDSLRVLRRRRGPGRGSSHRGHHWRPRSVCNPGTSVTATHSGDGGNSSGDGSGNGNGDCSGGGGGRRWWFRGGPRGPRCRTMCSLNSFDLTTQRRRRKEAHMTAQLLLAWCSLFQLFAHMKAFRRQASTSYHLTRPKPTERCKAFKVVGKYQAGEEKLLVTLRVGH